MLVNININLRITLANDLKFNSHQPKRNFTLNLYWIHPPKPNLKLTTSSFPLIAGNDTA